MKNQAGIKFPAQAVLDFLYHGVPAVGSDEVFNDFSGNPFHHFPSPGLPGLKVLVLDPGTAQMPRQAGQLPSIDQMSVIGLEDIFYQDWIDGHFTPLLSYLSAHYEKTLAFFS